MSHYVVVPYRILFHYFPFYPMLFMLFHYIPSTVYPITSGMFHFHPMISLIYFAVLRLPNMDLGATIAPHLFFDGDAHLGSGNAAGFHK